MHFFVSNTSVRLRWAGVSILFLLFMLMATPLAAMPPIQFLTALNTPFNAKTLPLLLGDMNNDGVPDLISQDSDTLAIVIAFGNGDGTFRNGTSIATTSRATAVAVGDLNKDGKNDLVMVDSTGYMRVFLGDGAGDLTESDFQPLSNNAAGAVALADFDNDGTLDVVVADTYLNKVSVLHGNGNGTFGQKQDYSVGYQPTSIVVADFNGDGKLDFAISVNSADNTKNLITVFLNTGSGQFQNGVDYVIAPGSSHSVVVGDFNGDGKPDLASLADRAKNVYFGGAVSVLLNNGDGTFGAVKNYGGLYAPTRLVTGDTNGDGKPDLLVMNYFGGTVSVLRGAGDGTFLPQTDYSAALAPFFFAVADLNGDGTLDMLVASYMNGRICRDFLAGNGDGTFHAALSYPTTGPSIAVADFDGDGIPDLASNRDGFFSVRLGRGDGSFRPDTLDSPAQNRFDAMVVDDFNKDGKRDIATVGDNKLTLYYGNGDGTFQAPVTFNGNLYNPGTMAVGDFNGDGWPDIVVGNTSNGAFTVYTNLGNGRFADGVNIPGGATISSVAVGDFNGDGKPDIIGVDYNGFDGIVRLLLNDGQGGFLPPLSYHLGNFAATLAVGDFNRDGKLDVVVAHDVYVGGLVTILLGDGKGGFPSSRQVAVGDSPYSVSVADFDGDGILDIATVNNNSGDVSVLRGNGDGTFQPALAFLTGMTPLNFVIADLNQDNKPDIVTINQTYSATVLLNTLSGTTTHLSVPNQSGTPGKTLTLSALLQAGQTPLAGRSLTFRVNGVHAGAATTDANGKAILTYTIPSNATVEIQPVLVEYAGDDSDNLTSGFGLLTVNTRANTLLTVANVSGAIGQTLPLRGLLRRYPDGAGVPNRTLTFKVDGTAVGTAVTGANGLALLNYTLPIALGTGNHTLTAEFAADAAYNASAGNGVLTAHFNVLVTVANVTGDAGKVIPLRALLRRRPDAATLVGKTVTFKIKDTVLGTAITDANGVARLDYTIPESLGEGNKTITAEFGGDSDYASSKGTGTLTIRYKPLITVANVSGQTTKTVALRALLRRRPDGTAIAGKTLTFQVQGLAVGSAVTGTDGVAHLNYTIPASLGTGDKTITVAFAGDSDYPSGTGSGTLTVRP